MYNTQSTSELQFRQMFRSPHIRQAMATLRAMRRDIQRTDSPHKRLDMIAYVHEVACQLQGIDRAEFLTRAVVCTGDVLDVEMLAILENMTVTEFRAAYGVEARS